MDHLIIHVKCPPPAKGGKFYTGCIGWTGLPYSEDEFISRMAQMNDNFANLEIVKIETYEDKEEYLKAKAERNAEYDRAVKEAEEARKEATND